MHRFEVWAPHASEVAVVVDGAEHPMGPADPAPSRLCGAEASLALEDRAGWWAVEVPAAGPGTDYAFRLDGGPPRPDPRSAWQPNGVHGPSRLFDPAAHRWAVDWQGRDLVGAVGYELHIGTFTEAGTLDAAIERLDHLVELGIDYVELMPVAAFDGRWGWGYDGVALYAVHSPYGGPAALQRFVDAAHTRGLAVCLDAVYNHLGPSGNYLAEFGPYFTDKHQTPWGDAVNLDDAGSAEVRRFICDNALRWLRDFNLDGLRLDAVHALIDHSPRHLLAQLSDEVSRLSRELARPLTLIAESDLNDPRMIEPTAEGGLGMSAQWDDDVHHAVHSLLTGERQGYYADFGSPQVLARVLTEAFRHAGDHSTFRGRPWGRPIDPARHRGHRFVVCAQNHDQIGNRAVGDRLSASLSDGRLAIAAAIILTGPFSPLLFMGEEWAASTPWQFFTDFPDPELAAAVREGRRLEFAEHGWSAEVPDPQSERTRDDSVLRWAERETGRHAALLAWYRRLIELRRAEPDLRADDLASVEVRLTGDVIVVRRGGIDVLLNLGSAATAAPSGRRRLLAGWGGPRPIEGGWLLPADGVAVASIEPAQPSA